MNAPVDVLAVMDVERELGVKQSTKNANAGFVDMRDWCAYLPRIREARAAVAELVEAVREERNLRDLGGAVDAKTLADAMRRTSAALARVQGGAQ